jgi:8-oxo-dGTP pyrophosphatase MutT (NUDIX family)
VLHLIPAPLHRRLYRIAHRARRVWWRFRRPRRASVIVVAFDARDRVLLVRHSYGPPVWSLPGGGIGRGEDGHQAAAREIREELACEIVDLVAFEAVEDRIAGSLDLRHTFIARLVGEPIPDRREIVDATLADPAELPEPCGRHSRQRIERALAHRRAGARSEKR